MTTILLIVSLNIDKILQHFIIVKVVFYKYPDQYSFLTEKTNKKKNSITHKCNRACENRAYGLKYIM